MIVNEKRKSFPLYKSWQDMFNMLDDAAAGKLIKMIYAFECDGSAPDKEETLLWFLFSSIKGQLSADADKWEKRSEKNSDNSYVRWHKNDTTCNENNANANERNKKNANANERNKKNAIYTVEGEVEDEVEDEVEGEVEGEVDSDYLSDNERAQALRVYEIFNRIFNTHWSFKNDKQIYQFWRLASHLVDDPFDDKQYIAIINKSKAYYIKHMFVLSDSDISPFSIFKEKWWLRN